jgi:hypothetical protein
MSRPTSTNPHVDLELDRIASLTEAARLSSLSPDTLVREHGDKVIRLSKRRSGMQVRDALMLTKAAPA